MTVKLQNVEGGTIKVILITAMICATAVYCFHTYERKAATYDLMSATITVSQQNRQLIQQLNQQVVANTRTIAALREPAPAPVVPEPRM